MRGDERIVFYAGARGCAGLLHAAEPDRERGDGVLIVPPWGWEEVASYRPRLRLAERLAAAGHPTVRYDLPGTGDSSGGAADPGQVDAWVESIAAGAACLRERGSSRIAVIGLGLGGLLARECLARGGGIDDLLLWAAPSSGRFFARELKALWRLQVGKAAAEEGEPHLPEGWIEVGGYVVSAETLTALTKLSPQVPADPQLRRALLLARDGVGADAALTAELRQSGVEVTEDAGTGWGGMVNHPERSELPAGTADRVIAWLRTSEQDAGHHLSGPGPDRAVGPARLVVESGGREVVETAFLVEEDFGQLFGILAEPVSGPAVPACAILLNAGAILHTGPNRMWVEMARRGAAAGVPTLRLDLMGIGESDGDELAMRDIAAFYRSSYEEQLVSVFDALEARGIGGSFLVSGLCAGAYWSARAGMRDPRVRSVVMLNGGAISWEEDLIERREADRFSRAFSVEWWRKLLRGSIRRPRPGELVGLALARARRSGRALGARILRRTGPDSPIVADLDRFDEHGTRLVLAFSGGEGLAAELDEEGIFDRLGNWPTVETCDLPGKDHTLRAIEAQRAAVALLGTEVDRLAVAAAE
jgi:pimeloyl-ACP methyl ester carboxylesterase